MDVAAFLRGPEIAGLCDRNRPMAWVEVRGTQSWKAVGVRAGYGPGGLTGTAKDQWAGQKSLLYSCSDLPLRLSGFTSE